MKMKVLQIKTIIVFFFLNICALFFKGKHWIIYERGTDARDNGYFFYKYLKKQHPEIKLYYIIDKKSVDYKKVKDDAIQFGSLKSFWLLITAEKKVSSHYAMGIPYVGTRVYNLCGLNKRYYLIRHGITCNKLKSIMYGNSNLRLLVSGAKPEYDFIKDTFGHPEGIVQYTGLARFDNLHNVEVKKQVLIMPTWRNNIRSKDDFLNSEYYKNWQSLLDNENLRNALEEKNIELIFYPHYEIQKFLDFFNSPSDKIKLASFNNYDVQTLLKESALLITDYSSVYFDFSYMRKPVIYFQFDYEYFHTKHYQKGFFDFKEMGFGEVFENPDVTADKICEFINNDFSNNKKYLERCEKFFPLYDTNNCERIYQCIVGDVKVKFEKEKK